MRGEWRGIFFVSPPQRLCAAEGSASTMDGAIVRFLLIVPGLWMRVVTREVVWVGRGSGGCFGRLPMGPLLLGAAERPPFPLFSMHRGVYIAIVT